MRQRSPQTIQFPDDQYIPGTACLKRRFQSQPLGFRSTYRIGENALTAGSPQGILLEIEPLVTGRYSRIADEHSLLPS